MASKAGTLWMGDLEPYMDEKFIADSFRAMGESLLQCKIIKNKITGLPLGYGFLEFGEDQSALRALHKCNGKTIPNSGPPKRFKLNHASYGKDQDFSIFVGDLTPEVDDLRLFNVFVTRYPSTRSAKVVLDTDGTSKGYGFIRFAEEKEQQRALVEMQGSASLGSKPMRVSLATPKNKQGLSPSSLTPTTPTTETTTTTAAPDYSSYYQSVYQQQYQEYYQNSWQNYQQYYNSYAQQYDQQYYTQQNADGTTTTYQYPQYTQDAYGNVYPAGTDAYGTAYSTEQADLKEHSTEIDVPKQNEELMARNEEFYASLGDSRWTNLIPNIRYSQQYQISS